MLNFKPAAWSSFTWIFSECTRNSVQTWIVSCWYSSVDMITQSRSRLKGTLFSLPQSSFHGWVYIWNPTPSFVDKGNKFFAKFNVVIHWYVYSWYHFWIWILSKQKRSCPTGSFSRANRKQNSLNTWPSNHEEQAKELCSVVWFREFAERAFVIDNIIALYCIFSTWVGGNLVGGK